MSMDVLFVDSRRTYDYLSKYILSSKFSVVHRETGEEAIAFLRNHETVCVVSALDLPDMTGISIIERIREVESEMPLAIFTHYQSSDIIKEINNSGAQYWNKAIILGQPELFLIKLNALVCGHNILATLDTNSMFITNDVRCTRLNSLAFPPKSQEIIYETI